MKKFCFIVFLLLSGSTALLAQSGKSDFKIQTSPLSTDPPKSRVNEVVGYGPDGFYMERDGKKGTVYIEKYDNKTLQMKRQALVSYSFNGKKEESPTDFLYFNEQLYAVFHYLSKKEGVMEEYLMKLDNNALSPLGDLIKISSIPYISAGKSGSISITTNEAKNVMAVMEMPYESKGDNESFNVKVYDKDLSKLWEKKVELKYPAKLFGVDSYIVDDHGNLYILGKLYKDKVVDKKDGMPNYSYKILVYGADIDAREFTAELDGQFITNLGLKVADDGTLVCAGFYSDKSAYSVKGTFFMSMDPTTGEVKHKGTKAFDTDFLEQFMSEDKAMKQKELYNYDLDHIILRNDGGALLVAEQYYVYVYTTSYTSGGITYYQTHYKYYYGSIIVVNLNPDYSIQWAVKIPKNQVTTDDGGYYSSYTYAVTPGKLYFFYNDNAKNLNNTDPKKIATMRADKGTVMMAATVSADGKLEKKPLFGSQDIDQICRPKLGKQVNDNTVIMLGQQAKVKMVNRIEIK